jgi:hypothetical protein
MGVAVVVFVMLGAILLHYIAEHDQLSGNGSSEIGV